MHQHEKPNHTTQLNRLQAKYHTLKTRLERAIQSGRFFRYTVHKQQQLLQRLQRYAQRLLRWGKLTTGTALVGTGLLVSEPLQGQFTEITTTASPFVFLDVDPDAPFGLETMSSQSKPAFADIDGDGDMDAFVSLYVGGIHFFENTSLNSSIPAFTFVSNGTPFGLGGIGGGQAVDFVDIDNDGDLDAFVSEYGNGLTRYFENVGSSTSPVFSLSSDSEPFGITAFGTYSFPIPDFVDIDQDGDLDIFIGLLGGSTRYFENTSLNSSIPAFTLSTSSEPFGITRVVRDAAPDFVDIDGDGDLDALIGDNDGFINFFENTSTNSSIPAFMQVQNPAPLGLSNIGPFAVPRFVDIDNDGDLDAFSGENDGTINFFENIGNSTAPDFQFPVLDIYENAYPALVDIDADGDLDLFTGEKNGSISYFENIGSSQNPDFVLRSTNNAFGITYSSNYSSYSTPTFVDIDNDGDFDLFIGQGDGRINFFENIGTSTNPSFTFISDDNAFGLSTLGAPANSGRETSPYFVDIDSDGDFDAFVGSNYSDIFFFENIGTSTNPSFTLISTDNAFGLSVPGGSSGAILSPHFVDIDFDGDFDAFVGDGSGINLFFNVGTNTSPQFVNSGSSEPFGLTNVGFDSRISIIDLDGDGFLEAVIGERDGTLHYFENNSILVPVELTTFSAKAHNQHVLLHWQTASETNNKGFHIERSSTGKEWKTIGFVNGQGTTVEVQDYNFRDEQPLSGANYYRLRQVDFDGSKHYSDVVQVSLKTTAISLSPNPVTDLLQVTNGEGRAIIYDLSGKVVQMAWITDAQATLQVQDLPQGQYVLSITRADGSVARKRFVK